MIATIIDTHHGLPICCGTYVLAALSAQHYTNSTAVRLMLTLALQAMRQAGLIGAVPSSQLLPLNCSCMADVLDSILHVRFL